LSFEKGKNSVKGRKVRKEEKGIRTRLKKKKPGQKRGEIEEFKEMNGGPNLEIKANFKIKTPPHQS
jgi:hypothetical protein